MTSGSLLPMAIGAIAVGLSPSAIFMSFLQDGLKWIIILGSVAAVFSIPVTIILLRSNRARGRGVHNLFLADRYIQVWLSKKPLDSEDRKFEHAWYIGSTDAAPWVSTLDKRLEKFYLVRRFQIAVNTFGIGRHSLVSKRRGLFFLYGWCVYLLCKWILIVFFGDSKSHYRELRR